VAGAPLLARSDSASSNVLQELVLGVRPRPAQAALGGRPWQRAHLLQYTGDVADRPVLNDLAVADAMDHDAFGLDLPISRWDS
jgi:hypothetical protein